MPKFRALWITALALAAALMTATACGEPENVVKEVPVREG